MEGEPTFNADLVNKVSEVLVESPTNGTTANIIASTTRTESTIEVTAMSVSATVNQNKRVHEAMDMCDGGGEADGGGDSDSEVYSDSNSESKIDLSSPQKVDTSQSGQTGSQSQSNSNVDLMQMMLMIRQQQHMSSSSRSSSEAEPLQRTASNSSTSSSLSSTSSVTDHMNENSLKQFIMSITANSNSSLSGVGTGTGPALSEDPGKAAQFAAAFADQFAYIVRSRSSSLSDTSSTSSSSCSSTSTASTMSTSANSSTEMLQNPATASIMKQMLSSYQAALSQPSSYNNNQHHQQHPQHQQQFPLQYQDSPISNRKASNASSCSSYGSNETSQIGQTSSLLNNCNLENTTTLPKQQQQQQLASASSMTDMSKTTDEIIKAKLNAVSSVKTLGQHQHQQQQQKQQVKQEWPAVASSAVPGLVKPETTTGTSPCRVCGDEASGFHYGVDSCEGCKGFFRRCITQGMNHQCTNQQQCEMTPFSRNSCQFCRLKKCFAVGMSREASRLGRRPKRPKDEKVIDGSWASGGTGASGASGFTSPSTTPSKAGLDQEGTKTSGSQQKSSTAVAQKLVAVVGLGAADPASSVTISSPNRQSKKQERVQGTSEAHLVNRANSIAPPPFKLEMPTKQQHHNQQQQNQVQIEASFAQRQKEQKEQKEQMQQIEMLTKLISISDRHTSIERTNELEFIRTAIIEAHCQIWPTTFEKIRHRYLERPPVRATNSSGSGIGKPGNSHEIIWDTFVDAMVPLIMDVVKYCKYIPSFNQIVQHDQVQLLKQGSFEVICVNSFMLVDAQNKLMLTPDMEYLMDATTIKTMPLGFFMSEVFELGIQVSPLKLSDAEIALFNALLVMNPDRGDLQDKDHIEELQSTLLHVLYKHLKYYRSDEPDLFCKLLKLIPIVQEINRKHSEALNTIKMSQSTTSSASAPKSFINSSGDEIKGDLGSSQVPVQCLPFAAHQPLSTGATGEFNPNKPTQPQHQNQNQYLQQHHYHQQRPQAQSMVKLEINTNGAN